MRPMAGGHTGDEYEAACCTSATSHHTAATHATAASYNSQPMHHGNGGRRWRRRRAPVEPLEREWWRESWARDSDEQGSFSSTSGRSVGDDIDVDDTKETSVDDLLHEWIQLRISNDQLEKNNAEMEVGMKTLDSMNESLASALHGTPTCGLDYERTSHASSSSLEPDELPGDDSSSSAPESPICNKRSRPHSMEIAAVPLHPQKQNSAKSDSCGKTETCSVEYMLELIEAERRMHESLLHQTKQNALLLETLQRTNMELRHEIHNLRSELSHEPLQLTRGSTGIPTC